MPPSGEGDNDNLSEVESDGTPSYHSGMKRSCSPQHEAPFKRQRVRKTSSARALSDMSDAICSMIDYLREPDHISRPAPLVLSSPARKQAVVREAIKKLEEDGDLSDDEQVTAIDLFNVRPSVADSYITIARKSLRTRFIQRQIQNFHYSDTM